MLNSSNEAKTEAYAEVLRLTEVLHAISDQRSDEAKDAYNAQQRAYSVYMSLVIAGSKSV